MPLCALLGPQSPDNHDDATNDSSANTNMQPVDEDLLLIMAEVVDAYVHSSYWDSNKLLFRAWSWSKAKEKEDKQCLHI